ncbi:hypothetical protein C2845_PM01G45130 [Panicum miliaceum]|uniref:Uncharacterized protein n=1 Tax=Panicum miliaceum TaxID=4540 RepID=A0A3L6TT87_PANMI|nr:hypothetical protein C2845_PM01G45130 [Panicum miliaceum]
MGSCPVHPPRERRGASLLTPSLGSPITRPGGQYEIEDDKALKGPKVLQLLRTIVKMREEHKTLSDQVAELTLELKSTKDDYDTLFRSLGIKIERLEKKVGKGN